MINSRRRIIVAFLAVALIGVAAYRVVSEMRHEPPGNHPTISEEAKKAKEADLNKFDQLRDDLENADRFELLSLDPNSERMLGKTQINDRATRKVLLDALRKGIADHDHSHIVMCFDPRHEIYATRNGNPQRLTICFECNQVEAWGGVKFQIADTPQPVFDRVLREAGVPLPEQSKK